MNTSKLDFLLEDQRKALGQQINRIVKKIEPLPVSTSRLLTQLSMCEFVKSISQIDPDGELVLEELTKRNNQGFAEKFKSVALILINLIQSKLEQFLQQPSLNVLKPQINQIVNSELKSKEFSFRQIKDIENDYNLWEILHCQVIQLMMGIFGFMKKLYEVDQQQQNKQLDGILEQFRLRVQPSIQKLSKIYVFNRKIKQSMISFMDKQISQQEMTQQGEDLQSILMQIEIYQKNQQEQQQMMKSQLQEAIIYPQPAQSNSKWQMIKNIGSKSISIVKKVASIFRGDSQYQQKSTHLILKQNLLDTPLLQNLQKQFVLSLQQKKEVLSYMNFDQIELACLIRISLSDEYLKVIEKNLMVPLFQWFKQNASSEQNQVTIKTSSLLQYYSRKLNEAFQNIQNSSKNHQRQKQIKQNQILMIVVYFYRACNDSYSPEVKRYLMSLFSILQRQITPIYLRGALKIIQNTSMSPRQLACLVSNIKPLRCDKFQNSQKSLLLAEQSQYINEKQLHKQLQKKLSSIRKEQGWQKQALPSMKILRLNHSPKTKTINIAISGFLSEDTMQDLEWMGLIRALEDSQLIGVSWQSSTVKEIVKYGLSLGMKLLNPINIMKGGLIGCAYRAINIGYKLHNFYQSNPFEQAHRRAEITGRYLAQIIISQFSDRFVNLIGFSLGSQVVTYCMARLVQRKMGHLVNRVLTMGGVADRQIVQKILQTSTSTIAWTNLESNRDYAVKYIYKLFKLASQPIGSGGLPMVLGHHLTNLQVGNFVKGHIDFRSHLYGISLLTGLIHE